MTPLQVQFSRALCNAVTDRSKMETCQTSYLANQISSDFPGSGCYLSTVCYGNRDGMKNNCEAYDGFPVLM